MNKIKRFESAVGGRWTGIIFHQEDIPNENIAKRPMRFCEAIRESSTGPLTLTKDLLSCPGALRSFGWSRNGDNRLAEKMAAKNGIKIEFAKKLIEKTPCLNKELSAITIGVYESPDVIVSYAQPEAAMRLVYLWQKRNGIDLDVTISSIMAVCGCVATGAYVADKLCVSFGCPESRDYGVIGNDRLIIGLSARRIENIFTASR